MAASESSAVPLSSASSGGGGASANVPKGMETLLGLMIKLKLSGDVTPMTPFPEVMTRVDWALRVWAALEDKYRVKNEEYRRAKQWRDMLFYTVPIAQMSDSQYARFVFQALEEFFNPLRNIRYNASIDGVAGEADARESKAIVCTKEQANRYMLWFHRASPKLMDCARRLLPAWDTEAQPDKLVPLMRLVAAQARAATDVFFAASLSKFAASKGATIDSDEKYDAFVNGPHGVAFTEFQRGIIAPFIQCDVPMLKMVAERLGFPPIAIYIVALMHVNDTHALMQKEHAAKKESLPPAAETAQ